MSQKELSIEFDPDGVGLEGKLFGLPFDIAESQVVIIPVPWEVTVSYGTGTAKGPQAVLAASPHLDLAIKNIPNAWKLGIGMLPISEDWIEENDQWRPHTSDYIKWLESGKRKHVDANLMKIPGAVDAISIKLNLWVKSHAKKIIESGKMVGVLGGDHSTALGLIDTISENLDEFGILHVDAHADLKESFEGFQYSHASIMNNVLKLSNMTKLVQAGIRDYSESEYFKIKESHGRIQSFFFSDLKEEVFKGKHWGELCFKMIENLPEKVYVSFDIDGLDPKLCPNTMDSSRNLQAMPLWHFLVPKKPTRMILSGPYMLPEKFIKWLIP